MPEKQKVLAPSAGQIATPHVFCLINPGCPLRILNKNQNHLITIQIVDRIKYSFRVFVKYQAQE